METLVILQCPRLCGLTEHGPIHLPDHPELLLEVLYYTYKACIMQDGLYH